MFRLDNIDDYTCLQAPLSIQESIQPATIVGGSIVAPLYFVANEREDDGIDNTIDMQQVVTMMLNLHLNQRMVDHCWTTLVI
jgi:hypothetical protein